MPPPTSRQIASPENLALAWARVRTSSNFAYKNYFRDIYQAFALDADNALADIRRRLQSGTYQPSTSIKVFFPKSSGVLRPITLLSVEDQVVYQAFGNVIADRLVPRVKSRYNRSVFGNLYAGKRSIFFYSDWRRSYKLYTLAMRRAFNGGYRWSASFDLTACYDSIDHSVLKYFLRQIGIDAESCDLLGRLLSHWTEASGRIKPLYHGHGIPQGPLTSGILSESVLRHFDDARRPRGVRYMRYVDDIRIFGRDPNGLRRELLKLDIRSKEIGLFPQPGKIELHRVANIDEELKTLSSPRELGMGGRPPSQPKIRRRLTKLSPRLQITNPTRFKFVLGQATPNTRLASRLLRIVRLHPSFFDSIFRHIAKYPRLSRGLSAECVALLREFQLYPSFTAALVRAIGANVSPDYRGRLHTFCRSRLTNARRDWNPELRAAAASCLIRDGAATWPQTVFNVRWSRNWWVRTQVIKSVDISKAGSRNLGSLCDSLIRDESLDVAIVGAQVVLEHRLRVTPPLNSIHPGAQRPLRAAGIIGRVSAAHCFITDTAVAVLGPQLRIVNWRKVLSRDGLYRLMLPRFAQWKAYVTTDPTAWVALTDTINDVVLYALYRHDGSIGTYTLGNIGSALGSSSSRFSSKYPATYKAAGKLHEMRLKADISHSITRSTSKPTRRIRFAELKPLIPLLGAAYLEIWQKW